MWSSLFSSDFCKFWLPAYGIVAVSASSSRHPPYALSAPSLSPFPSWQICNSVEKCIAFQVVRVVFAWIVGCFLSVFSKYNLYFTERNTLNQAELNQTKPNLTEPNRTEQNRFKLSSGLEDRKQNGIVNRRESNSESDKNQRFVVLFLNGENRKWSKTTPSCKNLLEFFVLLAKQTS